MTPSDLYRSQRPRTVDAARDAAAADYAERYDVLTGLAADDADRAKDAARGAHIAHFAGAAEEDDPEPRANLRDGYCCLPCHVWYIAAAQNRVGR